MAFVPPLMATACWPNQSIMPQSKGLSVRPGSRRSLRSSLLVQYKEQLKTRQTVATLCSFILILISEREDVNLPQPFLQSGEFLLRSGEGRV